MSKIYMITVPNLKTARDKCLPLIIDPHKTDFKIEHMIPFKNHTLTTAFDIKYKNSYRICKWLSGKAFNIQHNSGKVRPASIQHIQLLCQTDLVVTQFTRCDLIWTNNEMY